jgi:hypothetical protein
MAQTSGEIDKFFFHYKVKSIPNNIAIYALQEANIINTGAIMKAITLNSGTVLKIVTIVLFIL